jgi:hypothetical protein
MWIVFLEQFLCFCRRFSCFLFSFCRRISFTSFFFTMKNQRPELLLSPFGFLDWEQQGMLLVGQSQQRMSAPNGSCWISYGVPKSGANIQQSNSQREAAMAD